MKAFLCLALGTWATCIPAFADIMSQAGTPADLGANDSTSWAPLGGDGGTILGPFLTTSTQSITVTGNFTPSDNQGLVSVQCPANPSCSWTGEFNPGDSLIWAFDNSTGFGTGPISLTFSKGVLGVGAYLQSDAAGQFTGQIQVFEGPNSQSFTATSDGNGDPVFLGALDQTGANITKVLFSMTSVGAGGDVNDFAIDTLLMTDSSTPAVPEPSSLILESSVLLCLGRICFTRRTQ